MAKQNYAVQSKEAASVAKEIQKFAAKAIGKAQNANSLQCRISVFPESRFPHWATFLVEMLCDNPELTKLNNKQLAALIENDDGETGLNETILSKDLKGYQLRLVGEILRENGFSADTLRKGTDIKRIIKGTRTGVKNDDSVQFFHDSIQIGRTKYTYKSRRNPSGNRLADFRIRMFDSDVPLAAVLKLKNIGTTEFYMRDADACRFARDEHTVNRPLPEKKTTKPKLNTKVISTEAPNRKSSTLLPSGCTGEKMFELMQKWYINISPARRQTVGFHDFWYGMQSSPEFLSALEKFVNNDETQIVLDLDLLIEPDDAVVEQIMLRGDFISDDTGNLIDISTIRRPNLRSSDCQANLQLPLGKTVQLQVLQ